MLNDIQFKNYGTHSPQCASFIIWGNAELLTFVYGCWCFWKKKKMKRKNNTTKLFDDWLLKYSKRAFAFQASRWHILSRSASQMCTHSHKHTPVSLFTVYNITKRNFRPKKYICNIIQINDDDDNDDDDLSSIPFIVSL